MKTLAVLFVDLVDSTRLYASLGDEAAHAAAVAILARWEDCVRSRGGRVVKRIGDELLCAFDAVDAAARCAADLMGSLGEEDPCARIGLHVGSVVEDGADIYGDAVNLAARMVDRARPRQILVTEETVEALPPAWRLCTVARERRSLKGMPGLRTLHELVWEVQAQTARATDAAAPPRVSSTLHLRHGDQELLLDAAHPVARLGRQKHNDLVVPGDRVSRTHARIESRGARFVLVDESTNGTWVAPRGRPPCFLHREEGLLEDEGRLGLGAEPDASDPEPLCYRVVPH
jgi:class 3 adenylate cyclase